MRAITIAALTISLFLACSETSNESWEPQVMEIIYTIDGRVSSLPLIREPSRSITVDSGELLDIKEFTLQALPTVKRIIGRTIQHSNLPPVPESVLEDEVRVLAMIRKNIFSREICYDDRDMLVTEWVPVKSTEWKVHVQDHAWKLEHDWDNISLEVQTRRRGEKTIRPRIYPVTYVDLIPSRPSMKWNRRHNIFSRIYDQLMGHDRRCSGKKNGVMP